MFRTMDSTAPGIGPVRRDSAFSAAYSLAWMFMGTFFATNLIVGVIVDEFNRETHGSSAVLTPEQQQWVDTMKSARSQQSAAPLQAPRNKLRRLLYSLVHSEAWSRGVTVLILASVFVIKNFYKCQRIYKPFD